MEVEFSKQYIYDGKVKEKIIYITTGSRAGFISELASLSIHPTFMYILAIAAFLGYYHYADVPLYRASNFKIFEVVSLIIGVVVLVKVFIHYCTKVRVTIRDYTDATIQLTNKRVSFTTYNETHNIVLSKIDNVSVAAKNELEQKYNFGTIIFSISQERYVIPCVEEPEKFVEMFYEAQELAQQEALYRADSFYHTREHQDNLEKHNQFIRQRELEKARHEQLIDQAIAKKLITDEAALTQENVPKLPN